MQEDQQSVLRAALERAAATMRAQTPNAQVANRFGGMQPPAMTPNQYVAQNFPQPQAMAQMPQQQQQAPVPMPQPRPQQAPQQDMGFFERNSAMMQDPNGGGYIDPQAAMRAQSQHQGIIPNLMGLFGPPQTNANGGIRGASGPTSVGGAPLSAPAQDQGGLIQRMLGTLGSRMS